MKMAMFACAVAIVLISSAVFAAMPGSPKSCGPPRLGVAGPGMLAQVLDLSKEQRTLVENLLDGERDRSEPLMEQRDALRDVLEQAETATAFDESAVRSEAAALGRLETELAVIRVGTQVKINGLLNADQRKLLNLLGPDVLLLPPSPPGPPPLSPQ